MDRLLVFAAGLAGAGGVALSAAGAHVAGAENLATAGTVALAQAPGLLALGLAGDRATIPMRIAGQVIAAGILLFSGELAFHDLSGNGALAGLAPIGGTLMIAGWIGLAVCTLIWRKR